jgi:hypothetical protein
VADKKSGTNYDFMKDLVKSSVASIEWIEECIPEEDTFAGGEPDWLQDPEWPSCVECQKEMEFILQLSSGTLLQGQRDLGKSFFIYIEFDATLYFFHCETCHVSCSITQFT